MLNIYTFYDDKDMNSPIRRKCIESWKVNIPDSKITVLDHSFLNDVPKEFWSPHYQFCKDHNMNRRYLSDAVRLKMSQAIDNFVYIDSDSYVFRKFKETSLTSDCMAYHVNDKMINVGGFLYNKNQNADIQKMIDWYDNPNNYETEEMFKEMTDVKVAEACNIQIPVVSRTWFCHLGLGYMKEYTKGYTIKFIHSNEIASFDVNSYWQLSKEPNTIFILLRDDIPPYKNSHPVLLNAVTSSEDLDESKYWPFAHIYPLYKDLEQDLKSELKC